MRQSPFSVYHSDDSVKLLLAMTLITIQLLSGGVAPLYLCFCCDGSIYFDEGPEKSECRAVKCRIDEPECACCAHDRCDDEMHASSSMCDELSFTGGDYGCCIHLPISGSRTPTLISGRAGVDSTKFQICTNPCASERMDSGRTSDPDLRLRFRTRKHAPSLALRDGAFNLRC